MKRANSSQLASFTALSQRKVEADLRQKCQEKDNYIRQLQETVRNLGGEVPQPLSPMARMLSYNSASATIVIEDGSIRELEELLEKQKTLLREADIPIEYHDLAYCTEVEATPRIPTVGTVLMSLFDSLFEPKSMKKVEILAGVTGRILSGKMTLLIGPPGSGKSVLLKALCGRLRDAGGAKLSGDVYYNGDNIKSHSKFITNKVADYIEQADMHEPTLTVEETLQFAWMCSTGGAHSYARAKDAVSAQMLDQDNVGLSMVKNNLAALGLKGCKDVYVGNAMIRGVSGGQKRRVTVGEMLVCPRPVKMMDCISNGLDTSTAYDIIRAIRAENKILGTTCLISLLQPPPDVFNLFDEVIMLHEGHVIYHGSREKIMDYFASLGYVRPDHVDEADFLQELPTYEGRRFIVSSHAPTTAIEFAHRWKQSDLHKAMLFDMKYHSAADAVKLEPTNTTVWYMEYTEKFAGSFWYCFKLCLDRQTRVILRDSAFIGAHIGQSLIVGAVAGSLFSNISSTDMTTLNGFMFNTMLFGALSAFSMFPIIYDQKAVFYKQKDSLFFPTASYTLAQAIAYLPIQIIETILYVVIVYWSAGLADETNGSRFLTFILLDLVFSMCISQLFRLVATCVADMKTALPITGLVIMVMILFSGFIQPKSLISDGWIWFYWINPVSWALKSVFVNELTSSRYDFLVCKDPGCTQEERYGDFQLKAYGNPTEEVWIWYCFAVLVGMYMLLFIFTYLALEYVRTEPVPLPPVRSDDNGAVCVSNQEKSDPESNQGPSNDYEMVQQEGDTGSSLDLEKGDANHAISTAPQENTIIAHGAQTLPFDPVSMAFKDMRYTVSLATGEDVDLLRGVSGFFEPGTVTALMGSSGAGKTTLLDVLAGRKSTGVVAGEIFINGIPKVDRYFRQIMGYVEQFDCLHLRSTPKETITFNAALRLPADIDTNTREKWVEYIISTMELGDIENKLIGDANNGGMSFEQRKRVSIAIELAANPSILFLDEPTTGLDSRAAQAVIRNIRRIATGGRTVVCTIHQPSASIFFSFDSLLLLKKGGETVYFGELGTRCKNLIDFFQLAPNVSPIEHNANPATWMLEVIGAGTSSLNQNDTDFRAFYLSSALYEANMIHLHALMRPNEGSRKIDENDPKFNVLYKTSYIAQFAILMNRWHLSYWRTPAYTISRHLTMILIALVFASAYPQQEYDDYIGSVSRAMVIYITNFFCGILALLMATPVAASERPVFYKEQQSKMYSVLVYAATMILIEIPYLITSSLAFTLPFFFIVGFDNIGNVTAKFFWFWLFNFFFQATMLYLAQFFVAITPDEASAQVLGGLFNTVLGLFCGILIPEQSFPPFWLFMYWLNPLHYCLEALFMTQFHGDTTEIKTPDGSVSSAQSYIEDVAFEKWSYDHLWYDILALCLFIGLSMIGNFVGLAYLRFEKR